MMNFFANVSYILYAFFPIHLKYVNHNNEVLNNVLFNEFFTFVFKTQTPFK